MLFTYHLTHTTELESLSFTMYKKMKADGQTTELRAPTVLLF